MKKIIISILIILLFCCGNDSGLSYTQIISDEDAFGDAEEIIEEKIRGTEDNIKKLRENVLQLKHILSNCSEELEIIPCL